MYFTEVETNDIGLAKQYGNHDFEVEKRPLIIEHGEGWQTTVPDKVAIVRTDSSQYLGTVGHGYMPIQPAVLYEMAEELLNGTAEIGSRITGVLNLRDGRIIGIRFTIDQREYVLGDPIDLNFIMLTSFDSSFTLSGYTTIRRHVNNAVCNVSDRVYGLRHTRFVANRIQVVKNMLRYYHQELRAFDDKMQKLATHSMNNKEAVEWFRSLFPAPKSSRAEKMFESNVGLFVACLDTPHAKMQGVRGTRYGAFQALIEWVNYSRSVRVHNDRDENEVRFESIHFGANNRIIQKGFEKLTMNFTFEEDEFLV